MGERIWRMPQPPPTHVVSVLDADGQEFDRVDGEGWFWRRPGRGEIHWDELIFRHGPVREGGPCAMSDMSDSEVYRVPSPPEGGILRVRAGGSTWHRCDEAGTAWERDVSPSTAPLTVFERRSWHYLVTNHRYVTDDRVQLSWAVPRLKSLDWEWVRDASGTEWFTNDPYGEWWVRYDQQIKVHWDGLVARYGPIAPLRVHEGSDR
jgi:hypothetical protein